MTKRAGETDAVTHGPTPNEKTTDDIVDGHTFDNLIYEPKTDWQRAHF